MAQFVPTSDISHRISNILHIFILYYVADLGGEGWREWVGKGGREVGMERGLEVESDVDEYRHCLVLRDCSYLLMHNI